VYFTSAILSVFTPRAVDTAAQCIVIGPVCGFVCVFVDLLPRSFEIACIDPHQTGFVGKCSDQLIKCWPSCASGKGFCGGAKIFGSALLQPARSVCVSLSVFHCVRFRTADQAGWSIPVSFWRSLGLMYSWSDWLIDLVQRVNGAPWWSTLRRCSSTSACCGLGAALDANLSSNWALVCPRLSGSWASG